MLLPIEMLRCLVYEDTRADIKLSPDAADSCGRSVRSEYVVVGRLAIQYVVEDMVLQESRAHCSGLAVLSVS